jgi:hypothetical protein
MNLCGIVLRVLDRSCSSQILWDETVVLWSLQALEEARKQAEEDLKFAREESEAEISRLSQQIEEREKVWAANLDSLRIP